MPSKRKPLKLPTGIIAVTEVYENERSPTDWLCDTSLLDPNKHAGLMKALTEALNDAENGMGEMAYDDGFQGDAGDVAAVNPPCSITAQLMLYTD